MGLGVEFTTAGRATILQDLKGEGSSADDRAMGSMPIEAWVAVGVIAAGAVLAMLHALASAVRLETHIHDTKVQAAKLKRVYAEQVAAIEAARELNNGVEIVGQGSASRSQAA